MEKINNNIVANKRHLKKLDQRLKNEIKNRNQEIKNVQVLNNKRLKIEKESGQKQLVETEAINNKSVAQAIEHRQQKLAEIKENLNKQSSILAKEKLSIQNVNDNQIADIKIVHENRLQDTMLKASDEQSNLSQKVESEISKLNLQSENDISNHNIEMQNSIDQNAYQQDQKLKGQIREFEIQKGQNDKEFESYQTQKQTEHRNLVNKLLNKQKVEQNSREGIYKNQMLTMKKQHSQNMKKTDENYKSSMSKLIENHQSALEHLQSNFTKHMTQLTNELSTNKKTFLNKTQDEFYQIEKLNPSWKRDNTHYYFSIEVGPHEKDLVKVQAQDRNIKISIARNFKNETQDTGGRSHASARTEVLSQNFDVPDILDGNDMKTHYEAGILTFKVKMK